MSEWEDIWASVEEERKKPKHPPGPVTATILVGDALKTLRDLEPKSFHMCVTSPPYFGLRDYGLPPTDWPEVSYAPMAGLPKIVIPAMSCCLGLEPTPEAYIAHLVLLWRSLWRVLRDDATCWVNIGDSYAANRTHQVPDTSINGDRSAGLSATLPDGLKPKDLLMIPARLALALQADGWYLRMDNIWEKTNPMPESVTDRPTKAHEYVFLLSKSERYYYDADAIREPHTTEGAKRERGTEVSMLRAIGNPQQAGVYHEKGRNKRSVWTVNTRPYKGAHFAAFPPDLIKPCILAGTSEKGCCPMCGAPWRRVVEKGTPILQAWSAKGAGQYDIDSGGMKRAGIAEGSTLKHSVPRETVGWEPSCACGIDETAPCAVIDPFGGSGTTAAVSVSLGRSATILELNPAYAELAKERIAAESAPKAAKARRAEKVFDASQLALFSE